MMNIKLNMKGKLVALALGSALPLALLLAAALVGLRGGSDRISELYERQFSGFGKLAEVDGNLTRADINILRMLAIADAKMVAELKQENQKRFEAADRIIDDLVRTSGEANAVLTLRESYRKMRDGMTLQVEFLERGDREGAARVNRTQVKDNADRTFGTLAMLAAEHSASAEKAVALQVSEANRTFLIVVGFGLLAACATVVVSLLMARRMAAPLKAAADASRDIAQGDLSSELRASGHDEVAQLVRSLEHMRTTLVRVVSEIRTNAGVLSASARELATATAGVSEASKEQSDSAVSSAAALEEMTSSIASVSQNATSVLSLAREGQARATEGNEAVSALDGEIRAADAAVENIDLAVSEFVRKTHTITTMAQQVKDIADQTNLLALNAAIEAARAGEFGRGFAVVADEVRKLAEKSSKSATEIDTVTQELTSQSSEVEHAIARGRASLQSSRDHAVSVVGALSAAAAAVQGAVNGVEEIAGSIDEHNGAATSIVTSIDNIVQMAERNHCAVSATDRSAADLRRLAEQLEQAVGHFRAA